MANGTKRCRKLKNRAKTRKADKIQKHKEDEMTRSFFLLPTFCSSNAINQMCDTYFILIIHTGFACL